MEDETIGRFLTALASEAPVPGGGAAAALEAALGAALVSMVCNLTIGREKFRDAEALMIETRDAAENLRREALALADEDGTAFSAVGAAYGLPRGSDDEKADRQARIQAALQGAADVPLRTAALAARIVDLCAAIVDGSNPNVISDVGVAALSARAALDGAALNVRINLALIKDEDFTRRAGDEIGQVLAATRARADDVVAAVEAKVTR